MKEQKNLFVFSNDSIYREVDINEFEKDEVLCGNTSECDVRLRIKSTEEIIIVFRKVNNIWNIIPNNNVYYIINGIKTPRKQLAHGDTILVKHNIHKGELLNINYFIDFKSSIENYDLKISLDKYKDNIIGTQRSNNIFIKNELLGSSSFNIKYEDNSWIICDDRTKYGVYINGSKVENRKVINNNDFITIIGNKFFFKNGELFTCRYDDDIKINGLMAEVIEDGNKLFKYPAFLRSPRMILNYPNEEVEILKPPPKPNKPNTSFFMTLLPLVGTIGLTLAFRGGTGDNKFIYYSIGSVLLGAIVSLITIIQNKKNYEKECESRSNKYNEYIKEKSKELEELTNIQKNNMITNYPDINKNYDIVKSLQRRIWERSPIHNDFLYLRLGIGQCDPTFSINVPKREFKEDDDSVSEKPYELYENYKIIEDVPVMLPTKDIGSIGVVGKKDKIIQFIQNSTVDITTHHYSEDVKLIYILNDELFNEIKWIKWIPHTWSEDKKYRYISNNKERSHEVLKGLYKILNERQEAIKNESNKKGIFSPHYIVYITDRKMIENEPIVQFIGKEKDINVTFIFLTENIEYIPKESNCIINLYQGNKGSLQYTNISEKKYNFKYDTLNDYEYLKYAQKMTPLYVEDNFSEGYLRKSISLFELYNVKRPQDLKIEEKWSKDSIYKSMAAPLGVKLGDEVIELDLHEKHHGPHGLVAGTTGSGKSEILQSYVASMAINFHPHDVAFIVIDFKGGGMANQFKNLPHMVGSITNIDGNQIYRSLRSIDAELKKRQRVFAQYDVNHIDAYMKLYKSKNADTPIPHLIMIVDEFAELKSEHPDFMAKLISTARIGRSLGVHLILATQKPSGVVDNQIWSNSKFKLCLKVQTKEDSNEVIKTPLAAEIVDPGRSYLQVGNNEIFELFQSAWSGAKVVEDDELNKMDFEISEVLLEGTRNKIFSTKDNKSTESQETELENVISYIDEYCNKRGIKKLQGPWLEPLKQRYDLDEIRNKSYGYNNKSWSDNPNWMKVPIGIFDNPDEQLQGTLELDFGNNGHLMIVGSPTTGKTILLQTILVGLMKEHTPKEVNMYILDFGSRILKGLESAPHVGGVITSDDDEKMKNFMNFIIKEIGVRKNQFANIGVTSLQGYRKGTGEDMPHIMIAIDNFAAIGEYFGGYDDSFNLISREGANLGITIVTTANQANAIRYKMAANFAQRIALNCNDKNEYGNIIENCRVQPTNVQGRALISVDKKILEFHVALPFEGENEIDRAQSQKQLMKEFNSNWHGIRAKDIPMMPKILKFSDVKSQDINLKKNEDKYQISLGISHDDIEYKSISLINTPVLSLVGKNKTGKTNFINVVAKTLQNNAIKAYVDMYVFDSQKYGLYSLRDLGIVREYTSSEDEIEFMISEIHRELEDRYERISEVKISMGSEFDEGNELKNNPLILLAVDDADIFIKSVSMNKDTLDKFKDIVTKYRDLKVCIIIAGAEENFVSIPVQQAAKLIKDDGVGLLFDQIAGQRMFDFRGFRQVEKQMQSGDAYFYNKGKFFKVRTPVDDM